MKLINSLFSLLIIIFLFSACKEAKMNDECVNSRIMNNLDFWVGEWNVYNSENQLEGESCVTRVLGDCVFEENWESVTGYKAKSMIYLDSRFNRLKLLWLTDNPFRPGGVKEKEHVETLEDGSLVFLGKVFIDQNKSYFDRTIITPVSDHEVKQKIDVSIDNGNTWKLIFEGRYSRK